MSAREEINTLLKQHNAVLLRQKKHIVYKLPNGKQFVMSKTPSCSRAWDNHLAELKRGLGILSTKRTNPNRKPEGKPSLQPVITKSVPLADWRAQLKSVKADLVERLPWYKKVFHTRTWRRWQNYYFIARKHVLRLISAQPPRP